MVDKSVYTAISSIFFSMHRVNVQDNTYSIIKSTPTLDKCSIPGSDDYDANSTRVITAVSSAWSREEALEFVDRRTLDERMRGKNHISMEFLSYASELCKLHFFKEDEDENGNLKHVIFAVEKVDDERAQAVIDALSYDFRNVFWIDLADGTSRVIKMAGEIGSNSDRKVYQKFSYDKITSEYLATRVHPDDREALTKEISIDNLRKVCREREEYTGTYRTLVDGQVHHYSYTFYKLKGRDAVITGFRNIDDVIEQHNSEEKLRYEKDQAYREKLKAVAKEAERANKTKTEFLLRMSHDIRTPLNGIIGMLEIAEHFDDSIEKQRECRSKIKESSKILLELINEVLDMSKLESGEVVLEHVPFDLGAMAFEIFTVVEKQAEERGIEVIEEDCDVIYPNLIGSPTHYKRLVMNILGNAIKYNKPHGKIYITCREIAFDGKQVMLQTKIRDTGIGMSEEFQKHLFEPFMQENITARTKYGGTGLGMSITKNLVDKMGGTITFESEKGVGTTFEILIPFDVDLSAESTPVQEEEALESIVGETIILAEDNEVNLEIAKFMLEEAGVNVIEARNGKEAVEAFEKSETGEIAAILMDLMMPVMDGYEATKTIRKMARPDATEIPIIAMTANAFAEDRIATKKAGMNDHIAKPLDTNVALRIISKQIHSRQK